MSFLTSTQKQAPSKNEYEEKPAAHRHEDLLFCLLIGFASLGTTRIHDDILHRVWSEYLLFLKAHEINTEGFYSPSCISGRWIELENAKFQLLSHGFIEFQSGSPGYFFLNTTKNAGAHFFNKYVPQEYRQIIPLVALMVLSRYKKMGA